MGLFSDYLRKASSNARAGLDKKITLSAEEWKKENAEAQVKNEIRQLIHNVLIIICSVTSLMVYSQHFRLFGTDSQDHLLECRGRSSRVP